MPEPGSLPPSDSPSSTGPWPSTTPADGDPPTVRTGSDSGKRSGPIVGPGSGSGSAARKEPEVTGSSIRRNAIEIPALPKPGEMVDTFLLEESIGVGGMGAVFRGLDTRLDRFVALKVLPPDLARDPDAVQRFEQEGRAAARLDHDNIARVYSVGHDGSIYYIAFEYIEGTTIRQKVERDGILGAGEAIDVTLQIAAALVHASSRGVIHRDVKPSNIILTPTGRAKLVDMGLARRFERDADTGLTQTGMTLGTFDYISPEQARDPRDVDVRGDLYSLGCTLFFMLSGRPPFPDGTVLQKLIQHREEPPPDVRLSSPGVPDELAVILIKLMAKDRERRYQTPDQLVRDLLGVAGALGLVLPASGVSPWPSPAPSPAWERHLIWGVPALAFVVLVSALVVSSSQNPSSPTPGVSASSIEGGPRVKTLLTTDNLIAQKSLGAETTGPVASALPRDIAVNAGDDLDRIIDEAPPRSTILLADDGPYTLRPAPRGQASRFVGLDLTIKADLGTRPVIRLIRIPGDGEPSGDSVLFDLKGGRLVLEGLELVVEPGDRDESSVAIQAEDVDLSLVRCLFRRAGSAQPTAGQGIALRLRATGGTGVGGGALGRTSSTTWLDACHIDGGLTSSVVDGPAQISLRDVTIGASHGPTFLLRNPEGTSPASIHFNHVSLLAGTGPYFSISGLPPRIRVESSVFASPGDSLATLVESDDPTRLDWRGMDNLYGRIGTYLLPRRSTNGATRAATSKFEAWADDPATAREFSSNRTLSHVWDEADPSKPSATESQDPSRLFRLAESRPGQSRVGARQGPIGPVPTPLKLVADPKLPTSAQDQARLDRERERIGISAMSTSPLAMVSPLLSNSPDLTTKPMAKSEQPRTSADRAAVPAVPEVDPGEDLPEMSVMPPMVIVGNPNPSPKPEVGTVAKDPTVTTPTETGPGATAKGEGSRLIGSTDPRPSTNPVPTVLPLNTPQVATGSETNLFKSAEEFLKALRKSSGKGETLRISADADWQLPASNLAGSGSWTIRAEPGPSRPKVRFLPSPSDLAKLKDGIKPAWLTILTGSLRLEGVDVIVLTDLSVKPDGRSAFALGAGSDLSLSDCTVTVEGDYPDRAAIRVVPGDRLVQKLAEADPFPATVRLKNSLLRSGGDLIDVAPDQSLDLEVDNAVISTTGSLVHGRPASKGSEAKTLKLTFRQVSARVAGGIVQLDSSPEAPEPPFAEIIARNSIFATTAQGDPLIRIDGQDDPEAIRGRVHWDGHNVAYHRINTYRRDQVRKLGTPPTLFDRASWEVAVGRREATPIHDDLKFTRDWPETRTAWTLRPEDVQLRTDSPAALSGSGSDLSHIPNPPNTPS